jgi:myo-inositol-1(or 4)-monophosphatase
VLALETARPGLVAAATDLLASVGARRIRALGSVATTLCLLAEGRLDAMLSLHTVRSVDVAAGALILREAGGAVSFPEAGDNPSLGLDMRSRVVAARDEALLRRLRAALPSDFED